MPDGNATSRGANELLLVLGVAATVLGVALLSQGALAFQDTAHPAPPTHATVDRTGRLVPTLDERPSANTAREDGVSPTPMIQTVVGGATPFVGTGSSWHNPERDPRVVLMNMARQRRIAPERPAAHLRAVAKSSGTHPSYGY